MGRPPARTPRRPAPGPFPCQGSKGAGTLWERDPAQLHQGQRVSLMLGLGSASLHPRAGTLPAQGPFPRTLQRPSMAFPPLPSQQADSTAGWLYWSPARVLGPRKGPWRSLPRLRRMPQGHQAPPCTVARAKPSLLPAAGLRQSLAKAGRAPFSRTWPAGWRSKSRNPDLALPASGVPMKAWVRGLRPKQTGPHPCCTETAARTLTAS